MLKRSFCGLALVLQQVHAATPAVGVTGGVSGASVVQVLVGLVVVLAMVAGVGWLLKRVSTIRGPGAGLVRVIAGVPIGQRERIVLVEVGESWLVLGVAPGRISTLHTMARTEATVTPGKPNSDEPTGTLFATWLRRKSAGQANE